jgi:hypothetical protein
MHANDIKSCFRQIKHHPDVAGAFLYVLADYLFLQIGLTFGADFSPANWEAVRRAQAALAERHFSTRLSLSNTMQFSTRSGGVAF